MIALMGFKNDFTLNALARVSIKYTTGSNYDANYFTNIIKCNVILNINCCILRVDEQLT